MQTSTSIWGTHLCHDSPLLFSTMPTACARWDKIQTDMFQRMKKKRTDANRPKTQSGFTSAAFGKLERGVFTPTPWNYGFIASQHEHPLFLSEANLCVLFSGARRAIYGGGKIVPVDLGKITSSAFCPNYTTRENMEINVMGAAAFFPWILCKHEHT